MIVRTERPEDRAAVRVVNLSAFDSAAEADLVDALREKAKPVVSLVAEESDAIVGHLMFLSVALNANPNRRIMGLAPMAVTPPNRRKGVGSALVLAGLERCRELGVGAVVVLGQPAYYPRFGFRPAAHFGTRSDYEAPVEAFMLLEIQPGYTQGASGPVHFHRAFKAV